MSYAQGAAVELSEIPVIDIGPLRDGSDPARVAAELSRASRTVGFLYVANHGIEPRVIEDARTAARRFFALPLDEKLEAAVDANHRGFIRIGEAFMTEDARMDLKESFVWGVELPKSELATLPVPLPCANNWPAFMPGLKDAALPFFDAAQICAMDLLRGFAIGLGLAEDAFLGQTERPISRAALTYYPPQPPGLGTEQFGVAPHTDYGCLTVLAQDDVGGLQIERKDGVWIAAPPVPDTLVVNVGDLLARWSNGIFRSTPHRVVNSSGRERYSLVLAYDPNYETLVDPAVACRDGEAPKSPPIRCGDYIQARLDRSFKYRKAGN